MGNANEWTTRRLLSALCASGLALTAVSGVEAQVKLLPPEGQPNSVWFGDAGALHGTTAIIGASNIAAAEAAYMYENIGGTWTRVATLSHGTGANWDFGWAVDIYGDFAAVGGYRAGDTTQDGTVYMYGRNQGGANNWGQTQVLTPSNLVSSQQFWFGYSLGLDGDTLAVGAPRTDQVGTDDGTAYIFEHNGTSWVETAILTGHHQGEQLGTSIAISGDNVIVGAPRAAHIQGGVGSDGAAYIFNRHAGGPGNWGEVQKLTPSDQLTGDLFGSAVAISGNTAVVSAPWTDEIDENPGDNSRSGSVYIFDFNGTEWVETAQVHASDPQSPNGSSGADGYGYGPNSIATNGDLLVVASMRHAPADGASNDGAIFIYSRDEGGSNNWGEIAVIYGELNALDNWGSVVDVDGESFLVGARFDDDGGSNVGAAYIIPIPEPATAGLMAVGGAIFLRRRR